MRLCIVPVRSLAVAITALICGFAASPRGSAAATDAVGASARSGARVARVQVVDSENYFLSVANLTRSLTFYRNVIGLQVLQQPQAIAPNAAIEQLTNTPGALFRSATLALPAGGQRLLLMEFTRIERRRLSPRIVDPGAAILIVQVTQLQPVLGAARRSGIKVLTRGGEPVNTQPGERSVVLVDPDGFYVRVSQPGFPPPAVGPATPYTASNDSTEATPGKSTITAARMVFTVAARGPVIRFYHNVLGLAIEPGLFARRGLDELIDAPGARSDFLRTSADDADVLQFVAFQGVARHTYLTRPQDPGTAGASIDVTNLADALRRIRAAGAVIISAGGQEVITAPGRRAILIRDPAGLLLQLVQRS